MPTFVVQAGHGDAWEYVGPARGNLGTDPIDFGSDRAGADTHDADALRHRARAATCAGPA